MEQRLIAEIANSGRVCAWEDFDDYSYFGLFVPAAGTFAEFKNLEETNNAFHRCTGGVDDPSADHTFDDIECHIYMYKVKELYIPCKVKEIGRVLQTMEAMFAYYRGPRNDPVE